MKQVAKVQAKMQRNTSASVKPKKKKTVSLALSGSGFLAPIHVGAVCALQDAGIEIVEIAGTSGGSIIAAAVACGTSGPKLRDLAFNTDFTPFLKMTLGSILKRQGYCDGTKLQEWLGEIFGWSTFKDLKIPLTVVASDVIGQTSYVFSKETTPLAQVSLACRASSAVPFAYSPVFYDEKVLFDGGMVNNIPLSRLKGLGDFKLGVAVGGEPKPNESPSRTDFLLSMLSTLLASNEDTQELLGKAQGASIVEVDSKGVFFLKTDLTDKEKQELFDSGYSSVKTWLQSSS